MKKTIKLAFVGTSCIGKTSLLKELKRRYRGDGHVGFVSEAARVFFLNNPEIDRLSESTQEQIQKLVIKMEQEAHQTKATVILCDRSVIDCVAYLKATGNHQGADRLFDRALHWLSSYHRLLLLDPTDVPYKQDKVRLETERERNSYHDGFLDLFKERNIKYDLLSGPIKSRIDKVCKIIGE